MRLVQTVAPLQEPITQAEAKDFLRVLDSDSDNLILALIVAVREHVENITNRQLEVATFELYLDYFPSKLPKNPINSIEKIEYMDESGTYQLLDSSLYYLYVENGIGMIEYLSKPLFKDHKESIKITFTSGYDLTPEPIKQYMRVKISTLFENREEFVVGASISSFNDGFIENLLNSYKVRSV